MTIEILLLALVLLAGFYMAWSIGANDAANAMGTSVGSGALLLKQAILISGLLEFFGAFLFGSHVSGTIQQGIVNPAFFASSPLTLAYGMLASLLAAAAWMQIASYYGWPVSTTHSIVGAIMGFGIVAGGTNAIYWENAFYIFSSWILSPFFGGFVSFLIFTVLRKQIFYQPNPLQSAKKLTPVLVFIVFTTLTMLLLFKGLENLHFEFSFLQALLISLGVGGIAAGISYVSVKEITEPEPHPIPIKTESASDSEMMINLDKAKKYLHRVQKLSSGELQHDVSLLIDDVRHISHALEQTIDKEVIHSQYALVEKIFVYLQIMTACLMAFAHGANDVANAIGPLSAAVQILTTQAIVSNNSVPIWALAVGGVGIVIGLATWGWRVMETIGKKITELTPTRGFAAEFGAAATILIASRMGLPISTTHTLVGSVIGVALARGIGALNLSTMRDILMSWLITVPAGAVTAILFFFGLKLML